MKKYTTIFFDLDHTLWDFERNSAETLEELYHENNLVSRLGIESGKFIEEYKKINFGYWEAYRKGEISKEALRTERFRHVFSLYELENDPVVNNFASGYVKRSPEKTHVFPHTHEILDYLSGKYSMYIITNGFEDIQHRKLANCGIVHHFKDIVTSEKAGVKKPFPEIYHYGLRLAAAIPAETIMIGDEPEVDLSGARDLGIDQVYFNSENEISPFKATFEINSLAELRNFL